LAIALAYAVLETKDPERWDAFLQKTVGLAPGAGPGAGRYYRMDDFAWRLQVRQGEAEGLGGLGMEYASAADLDAAVERLASLGTAVEADDALARERRVLRLVRATDPGGARVELVCGRTLGYEPFASPAGVSRFVTGDQGAMGLGHFVLPAQRIEESRRFWMEGVGMALTDTMTFPLAPGMGPSTLYFLHAMNARHHSIALLEAPSPTGIVHLMVEAGDIDDVGRFIDRCARDGVHIAASLGRHSNDRMVSAYAVTPGGYMIEFGCDGLQIDWRNWTPTTSLAPDLWGHKFSAGPQGDVS
jgi:3,4-dihydroxy-9,10-secoandrosta-1,3,5(10)-triene-9,17-dione 4,5-dioxygenase